jgi:hypothetical protein
MKSIKHLLANVVVWVAMAEHHLRVFGSLFTWLSERSPRYLLFATANDISQLPPEFFAKDDSMKSFSSIFRTTPRGKRF